MSSKITVLSVAAAAAALLCSQTVRAADPAPAPVASAANPVNATSSSFYQQLVELRSQNAILVETLKNAKLKSEISAATSSATTVGAAQNVGAYQSTMGSFTSGPQVLMVSGTPNQLIAVISLANGSRVNAHVGSQIAGLGTVKSISRDEVIVANKTQIVSVPFAVETVNSGAYPVPPVQSFAPVPVGLPPAAMQPGGAR